MAGARHYWLPGNWDDVDPGRHPFDPSGAEALVATVEPPVDRWAALEWGSVVDGLLAERYGAWILGWQSGVVPRSRQDWLRGPVPPPDRVAEVVAGQVVEWRGFLVKVAERIERHLPVSGDAASRGVASREAVSWKAASREAGSREAASREAGSREAASREAASRETASWEVAAWETAAADLVRTAAASAEHTGAWPGWAEQVLQWFLTATGMTEDRASALAADALRPHLDASGYDFGPPVSEVAVNDIAERLARDVLGVPAAAEWPDTWPESWPVWRATNTRDDHKNPGRIISWDGCSSLRSR